MGARSRSSIKVGIVVCLKLVRVVVNVRPVPVPHTALKPLVREVGLAHDHTPTPAVRAVNRRNKGTGLDLIEVDRVEDAKVVVAGWVRGDAPARPGLDRFQLAHVGAEFTQQLMYQE